MIDRSLAEYQTVAAGQTGARLGSAGGGQKCDFIRKLVITPATTSPGAVTLIDGATSITVFAGGATSVADLKPFAVPLDMMALNSGGWSITTGLNVSVIAVGNFS